MCPKPARLATALVAVLGLAATAPPAFALFGSSKSKPATSSTAAAGTDASATSAPSPRKATPEERAAADRLDPLARATFWAREVQVDPTDVEAGVRLSVALRALGRYDEATQAADAVLVVAPTNMEAILEDSRAKIGAGQGFYAIDLLKKAETAAPKDWRPWSLMGVALEQSERGDEAKAAYEKALQLSPDNPAVLSNLGLMYAGEGDKAQAEILLRKAVSQPGAAAAERQNLALVLGLQGKMAEAEKLIRQDLPPAMADANLAWLKGNPGGAVPQAAAGRADLSADSSGRTWAALEGDQNTIIK